MMTMARIIVEPEIHCSLTSSTPEGYAHSKRVMFAYTW